MKGIFALLLVGYTAALSFHIEYRDLYCFTFTVDKETDIDVFYHITGSNPDRVTVQLLDYQKRDVQGEKYANQHPPEEEIMMQTNINYFSKLGGQYSLCFQRTDNEKKSVYFSWTAQKRDRIETYAGEENIQALEKKFEQVAKVMGHISEHIQVQEMDEAEQHRLTKANNSKVLWWSLLKILIIILSCLLEVYLVTSYFAGGNSLGRKLVKIGMKAESNTDGFTNGMV